MAVDYSPYEFEFDKEDRSYVLTDMSEVLFMIIPRTIKIMRAKVWYILSKNCLAAA